MTYQFVSAKQRRWFFANHYRTNYQTANYYSAGTGWIHIDSLKEVNGGLPPEDYSNFDKWLMKHGWGSIKDQMKTIQNLPPWIRWLAELKTTALLINILMFVLTLGGGGLLSEAGISAKVGANFKTEIMEFTRSPMFRSNVIRGNLVRAVIRARKAGGSITGVISKFEPYLKDAKSLGWWAFNNAV